MTADTAPRAPASQADEHLERRYLKLKIATMAGATAFITASIWMCAPVLALWVGAQVVAKRTLSMGAVGIVVLVLAVLEFVLTLVLTWLNNVYDELVGRPRTERRATWLRSMRAEDEGHVSQRVGITTLELIVMVNVYVAVTALAVWWAFFSGAPSPTL